jgi:hypothetical protein
MMVVVSTELEHWKTETQEEPAFGSRTKPCLQPHSGVLQVSLCAQELLPQTKSQAPQIFGSSFSAQFRTEIGCV